MTDPMIRRHGAEDAYEAALRCVYATLTPYQLLAYLDSELQTLSLPGGEDDDCSVAVAMESYRRGFVEAIGVARTLARFAGAAQDRSATTRAMVEQLRSYAESLGSLEPRDPFVSLPGGETR